jgi:hypothetical protein
MSASYVVTYSSTGTSGSTKGGDYLLLGAIESVIPSRNGPAGVGFHYLKDLLPSWFANSSERRLPSIMGGIDSAKHAVFSGAISRAPLAPAPLLKQFGGS